MSREPAPFHGLSALGQIAITVSDLPAAIAFYRDTLGLPFLFEAAPGMAFFQLGDVRLLVGAAQPGHPATPASVLYFRVEAIDEAHAALARRGVRFQSAPHLVHRATDTALWLAEFAAPEGATHALMEERRTA